MGKLLATLLLFAAASARAELAVIVHAGNKVEVPSHRLVQDIFLGRARMFPNGEAALPIDQSSSLRAEFYQLLTERPIEQINAYWARLMFTGQSSPPPQVRDDGEMLRKVRDNVGAIGYVDKARVDATVRVLFFLPP